MHDISTVELVARLAAGVLLTAANAFFVVTEFALTRAPQLGRAAYQGSKPLRLAWRMTEELEIYLTGCQLGISVTSVLLGVIAEPGVSALLRPLLSWLPISDPALSTTSVVVGVVVIQLVHKIWGEQAPTYLGVERPREVARYTAPALYAFTKIAYPVIRAGDGIAKLTLRLFGVEVTRSWSEDVRDDSAREDAGGSPRRHDEAGGGSVRDRVTRLLSQVGMPRDRKREVERAVAIDEIPVGRIATPRERVDTVPLGAGVDDVMKVLRERPKVRLPLVAGSLDEVVGVLHAPVVLARVDDLRRGETTLEALAVEPLFVDADLPVAKAIDRLQSARREMVFVQDGERCVGVLTTTDCFEAIVGQLEDPYD